VAIKTVFSIKDLENLSGVKAHTIRIWEKRYALFSPERSETNIRIYNLDGLKKLLNVTHLYNEGHKISKIATLGQDEIITLTKESSTSSQNTYLINKFKTAMFSFDFDLFHKTYKEMEEQSNFNHSFENLIIPLLAEIGMLWLSGTVDPSHERFISELIRQKLSIETDKAQQQFVLKNDKIVALYLPYNEIHEIGLVYAQYLVVQAGFKTVYLGSNIPLESLTHVKKHHENLIYMTYLTTEPSTISIHQYLQDFNDIVCTDTSYDLWCLGTKANEIDPKKVSGNIKSITKIQEFNKQLKRLANA
jgi:DNA-binding transcriptional MerR regulator